MTERLSADRYREAASTLQREAARRSHAARKHAETYARTRLPGPRHMALAYQGAAAEDYAVARNALAAAIAIDDAVRNGEALAGDLALTGEAYTDADGRRIDPTTVTREG